MRDTAGPLRVDVWGQVQAPLRIVRRFSQQNPDLVVELSMRRGLSAALDAVGRQELDAAFGRPYDLDHPWPAGLEQQPVLLEPLVAMVADSHPLEDAQVLGPDDLRAWGLWFPLVGSPSELIGFFRRYCDEHRIPGEFSGTNLGLDHFLSELPRVPERVALMGEGWPLPTGAPLRLIPIEPTPCYPWSFVWRAERPHPAVARLLDFLLETRHQEHWQDADSDHIWIPSPDRATAPRHG
jgi:DNA-binding transcriptional LysR family regulator